MFYNVFNRQMIHKFVCVSKGEFYKLLLFANFQICYLIEGVNNAVKIPDV